MFATRPGLEQSRRDGEGTLAPRLLGTQAPGHHGGRKSAGTAHRTKRSELSFFSQSSVYDTCEQSDEAMCSRPVLAKSWQ